jgi:hypothetical protein
MAYKSKIGIALIRGVLFELCSFRRTSPRQACRSVPTSLSLRQLTTERDQDFQVWRTKWRTKIAE